MRYRVVISGLLAASVAAAADTSPPQHWPMFGGNVESTSSNPIPADITAANVAQLTRRQLKLPGTVDASAIYLTGVAVRGAPHNAIFVTTTYGKTLALDADSGGILWEYTPPAMRRSRARARSPTLPLWRIRMGNSSSQPRRRLYPKLPVSDGQPLWRTSITSWPRFEKMRRPSSSSKVV